LSMPVTGWSSCTMRKSPNSLIRSGEVTRNLLRL
jgi:hypothetical protein